MGSHGKAAFAQRHAAKSQEMHMREAGERQKEQAIFNVQVRQMRALEAIAEALHVAYEPQIDAFRKRMAEQQAEEDAAAAKAGLPGEPGKDLPDMPLPLPGAGHAIDGIAKAESVEGPDGLHVVEVESVREPPASP